MPEQDLAFEALKDGGELFSSLGQGLRMLPQRLPSLFDGEVGWFPGCANGRFHSQIGDDAEALGLLTKSCPTTGPCRR